MKIGFLLGGKLAFLSGPNLYNQRVIEGLCSDGHDVAVIELPGQYPVTDETARSAARGALASLPADRLALIDGLALPAFAGQGDSLAARPTVALIHHPTALGTGISEAERAALRNTELRLLPRCARVLATSEATAERLAADFGLDRARLRVVVAGIDPAPRAVGSGGAGCAILSIGALIPRKGHHVLIRSLARLFDLDWHLTIVGSETRDPAHVEQLRVLAAETATGEKISFAGEPEDAELQKLWQGTDIFALASFWEGYPIAVAQALKRGVPVAITNEGPASGLVPMEAGIVCKPGDDEQYSKALRRMIFDTDLRSAMAAAAWTTGQSLPCWERQIAAFVEALTL
jgi:glycosyltransferase involved in cell wall biosynthesis